MSLNPSNIAIIGASGTIGQAFIQHLSERYPHATIHSFSRNSEIAIDYMDEQSIETAANTASKTETLDLVLVTTGILHTEDLQPEKSLKQLSSKNFQSLFEANTIAPALIAKYFLPKLNKDKPATFAALSARVGSISDNRLGGWYAYRASKAALNMIIKTASIEMRRTHPKAILLGLHPGTVDSPLSKPFQKNLPEGQLLTPQESVKQLLEVILKRGLQDTGKCFAFSGEEIEP